MEKEYIIAFSSFYKAAYAHDMLEEEGINASLRKLPTELIRSCGTGLYLRTSDIRAAQRVFENRGISVRGIYEIDKQGSSRRKYVKVRKLYVRATIFSKRQLGCCRKNISFGWRKTFPSAGAKHT